MDELKVLFPEREIKTSLGAVEVAPFKFGQLPKVLAIASKYFEVFATGEVDIITTILQSGEDALDDLAQLAFFCTGKEREWLDQLPGDEALDLFFKVFEVNADFFVRGVRQGADKITARIQSLDGAKSSPR